MRRRDLLAAMAAGALLPSREVLADVWWRNHLIDSATDLEDLHVKDFLGGAAQGRSEPVRLDPKRHQLLKSTVNRLQRLQRLVGYGNFNLLDYQRGLYYARNYERVGAFTQAETELMEELFYADARRYGFFGEKVMTNIDAQINEREVVKIPRTGHYLYKGAAQKLYQQVRREVGDNIILTSGVRGVLKQIHLFMSKSLETQGDLSLASYSLAPPGHSFHGVGDFDVGKVGWGERNFSAEFAKTREYHRLTELGYVLIRYPNGNPYGVRYEPWHVKVV